MLRVLLESSARRQRRPGGAALSVATHLAIIGAISAASFHGRVAVSEKPKAVTIHFAQPTAPPPLIQPSSIGFSAVGRPIIISVPILRIPVPAVVPTTLPPIGFSPRVSADSIVIGATGRSGTGPPRTLLDGDTHDGDREWRGSGLAMHILATASPRYPESLRQAGIGGRVLVRFTVDTTGRVDVNSIRVLSSTHDLFTAAVRDALVRFRFRPAEISGRRVTALAEMPFEFQITREH